MARRSRPGLTDIAREAGVSVATASRALSQPELVRDDTLERVLAVARSLGYVPDRAARALASGRTSTVGVVIPTLNSPVFASTLQEMQRNLAEAGFQLLVASHEYDPASELAAVEKLLSHGVDGLVLVGGDRLEATWRMIDAAGVPILQMWCGRDDHPIVGVDNHLAGLLVARHLLELGHRRIGVITGNLRHNDRQAERLRGIRAALAEAGLSLPAAHVTEQPLSVPGGRGGCAVLLELADRPTAIIGTVDVIAIGAMAECQARGIRVPSDISVAGIDNVELAAHVSPSLTTVNIPSEGIGAQTVAAMLRQISGGGRPESIVLPIELVERHSSALPRRKPSG
ncbi:LacI family DNA-binding transcriptional regulator [Halovulum dunhuangense]|uniref:LacI family DNA-binding transcriptional regulator n=1 Tax=Halovulum dunhuangense TaxID=1505036 RepID=A0A849L601_9RHOB|nr:LacI family DNA-binding transcriptional regulator [Halovulum dunhuangense]NNU81806.1 LacI family DNA-binding transcriptional regulator [Halovulum dunhuangense]